MEGEERHRQAPAVALETHLVRFVLALEAAERLVHRIVRVLARDGGLRGVLLRLVRRARDARLGGLAPEPRELGLELRDSELGRLVGDQE